VRIDAIVLGFAAVDGFEIQGVTKDERDVVVSTEIGKPVPGKHTFGGQDDLTTGGRNGREQRFWGRGHVSG